MTISLQSGPVRRLLAGAAAIAAALSIFAAGGSQAQEPAAELRPVSVGVYVSPPFVIEKEGRLSGMAIELWEALAAERGLRSEYHRYDTLRDLAGATTRGDVEAAVTNLTITQERAKRMDFTHPWYDAGLRIMVNEDANAGFRAVLEGLYGAGHLQAYAWLAFVILAATVLLTIFDRRFDDQFPRRWRNGLAESFYTVMSVATSGPTPSRKNLFGWIGRIGQGVWLVCGIAVLAYVTSTVTSVMTTLSLTSQINGLADLRGKTVGVFSGSVAEEYARESAIPSRSFKDVDEAVSALLEGRVVAVVGDAPVLEYYAHSHPDTPVAMVGAIFEPDKYGFAFRRRSQFAKPLSVDVIGAHESGLIENLKVKYFGDNP